jgi:hypothetical protein
MPDFRAGSVAEMALAIEFAKMRRVCLHEFRVHMGHGVYPDLKSTEGQRSMFRTRYIMPNMRADSENDARRVYNTCHILIPAHMHSPLPNIYTPASLQYQHHITMSNTPVVRIAPVHPSFDYSCLNITPHQLYGSPKDQRSLD